MYWHKLNLDGGEGGGRGGEGKGGEMPSVVLPTETPNHSHRGPPPKRGIRMGTFDRFGRGRGELGNLRRALDKSLRSLTDVFGNVDVLWT